MTETRWRVIIVNDDPLQLERIVAVIEQEHGTALPFGSAADALTHVAQYPDVDLVITDLHMPGIDGWRFCHLLRSSGFPSTNKTPILVISAAAFMEDAEKMPLDAGADAFLSMPYTADELQQIIRQLLRRPREETHLTVLVVETEAQIRAEIAAGFVERGYCAFQAGTGPEALDLLSEHPPDVAIVHHDPPQIDGPELIPPLRSMPHTVIMALTDGQEGEVAAAMIRRGADIHISAPYTVPTLLEQATRAQHKRAMLRIEEALETWVQDALQNARRIQRLNDCLLDLGTDHSANIQMLTRAMGDLLNADCVLYNHQSSSEPYTYAYYADKTAPQGEIQDGDLYCLDIAQSSRSKPVVLRHVSKTPYAQEYTCLQDGQLETYIECPVHIQDERRIGVLCAAYTTDYAPSGDDLTLVQLLARVIGRQEYLDQRERELVALNKISRIVASTPSLEQVLAKLRHEIRDVIGAEACSIALIDPKTGELVFRQADDPLAEQLVGRRLQPKQGIAGLVAHTGHSILVPNAAQDPRFYPGIDVVTGLKTREIICAPLIVQDRTIGVIEIVNKRQGSFTTDDVRLLESVAAQTASTIENATLHEATQRELNERIKAEQALRESKTRLQTFVDVTPDLIYLKDKQGRYLLVNQAFRKHWDLEQQEVIGHTDQGFMPSDRAQIYAQAEQQVMQAQQSTVTEEQQGGRVYEIRRTPVIDEQGETVGLAGVIRDITERKQLQEQIVREQKEESILTLATGIVHDFNNALVGIVGNIDILRLDLPDAPEIERTLEAMEKSAQRMVDLTSQLLAYAGGTTHRLRATEPNRIVRESLTMLKIPKNIVIERDLAPDLWSITADPSQIKQVVLSVLTNACEAMSEQGGTLHIQTENRWAESWTCRAHRQHPGGEYVHIEIKDTGPGMDDKTQQHLFEPFFSTKFLGRGLGLAAAQGIVRDHGGCIEIESIVDQGTTVHIHLPRGTTTSAGRPSPQGDQVQGQVLIVEREPIVQSLIQRALSAQGYAVFIADDVDQALRVYKADPQAFKLILLDLGLSNRASTTLLDDLRAQNPGVHVLLTSSYGKDMATQADELGDRTRFLQKPFSLQELNDSVRALLEEENA